MSDWDEDDYDNDHQNNNQQQQSKGGGLRQQLEAALKQNKELQKQLGEAKTQLRGEAVARVIQSKGLKSKVSKLIPADVEPTEEAITKWLDEWGDVFGVDNLKATPQEPEGAPAGKPAVEPNHDDDLSNAEYADKMRAMGQLAAAGQAPMKDSDVMAKLSDPNLDRKTLIGLIQQHGGGYGSG